MNIIRKETNFISNYNVYKNGEGCHWKKGEYVNCAKSRNCRVGDR